MTSTFILAIIVFLSIVTFAIFFRKAQNSNTQSGKWVGGEISWPKAFWLAYAVGAWFLIPIIFIIHKDIPHPLLVVFLFHAGSWWIRGILELVMIYKWFNWTPIYGISHDAIHNVILVALTVVAAAQLGWSEIVSSQFLMIAFSYLILTSFALMAEMVFAALFIMTRGKDHKIYFASDSPEFKMINRLTLSVCVIVYTQLILQTIFLWNK